ncbi:hypothetical protein IC757_14395 [Wenzhouxiangella sp. AB-CW3]|uniref:hypothetical protein n=1 Tax=Wenzhouxiangella sp. AB-CW3 TaxID=2771012 RepID=UPI00168B104E|nr:hypothetical protein [Wenzhouxiangella sp. AB-CW3]QOC22192.1 hypothetical protein IC757_14395 [Wenzhouxiangella sp. AB-CW3]
MSQAHITRSLPIRAILFAACLAAGMIQAAAEPEDHHHHHHHHDGELELALNNGERWGTDESLRTGMDGIFEAFAQAHDAYRSGALNSKGAASLADQVDEQVQFIFANCNLPADADAELHKLLAATFGATATLRESDDPHDGLHQLHAVLKAYGEHFEHPGWSAAVSH